jgi:hypothetical protein
MLRWSMTCLILAFLLSNWAVAQRNDSLRGYEGVVELFAGTGRGDIYQNPRTLGFHFVNGYRFGEVFTLGLGVGLITDRGWPWLIPVSLDARLDLVRHSSRPFLQLALGYGLVGTWNAQVAIGARSAISRRLDGLLSIAARFQGAKEKVYSNYVNAKYAFVELRVGIAF